MTKYASTTNVSVEKSRAEIRALRDGLDMAEGENLDRLLAEVKRRIASYSQAELDALHKAQRESWVRGEMAMAKSERKTTRPVKP